MLAFSGWRAIFWSLVIFTTALLIWVSEGPARNASCVSPPVIASARALGKLLVGVHAARIPAARGMVAFNFAEFFL